jgi:hypothetical protein
MITLHEQLIARLNDIQRDVDNEAECSSDVNDIDITLTYSLNDFANEQIQKIKQQIAEQIEQDRPRFSDFLAKIPADLLACDNHTLQTLVDEGQGLLDETAQTRLTRYRELFKSSLPIQQHLKTPPKTRIVDFNHEPTFSVSKPIKSKKSHTQSDPCNTVEQKPVRGLKEAWSNPIVLFPKLDLKDERKAPPSTPSNAKPPSLFS